MDGSPRDYLVGKLTSRLILFLYAPAQSSLPKPYKCSPSREEVEDLVIRHNKGNCVPIYVTLPADLLTPVGAYLRLTDGAKQSSINKPISEDGSVEGVESFLLESVVGGVSQSRYSFVGSSSSQLVS